MGATTVYTFMVVVNILHCLSTRVASDHLLQPQSRLHPVNFSLIRIGGLVAGESQNAWIFYPSDFASNNAKFPVLSFGHGFSAGGDTTWCAAHGVAPPIPPKYPGPYCLPTYYHLLLKDISQAGFIIVATASCPDSMCSDLYKDMAHCLETVQQANRSLIHPVLAYADLTAGVGIFGHSLGAINAPLAAEIYKSSGTDVPLKAIAYLHAGSPNPIVNKKINVPIMTTTGSADKDVPPAEALLSWQEQHNAHPKIFANLKGAVHNESVVRGRLNPYIAIFFNCFVSVKPDKNCSLLLGNGSRSLCKAYPFQSCSIVQ